MSTKKEKLISLVGDLLNRWDDLPNDVASMPELEQVEIIISKISNIIDDDSEGIG